MITITLKESINEYTEYDTSVTLSLPDECTSTEAVSAFVRVLRAAGYIDSSIFSALEDAAEDLREGVEVSYKHIPTQESV